MENQGSQSNNYIGDFFLGLTGVTGAPVYFGAAWLANATFAPAKLADGEGTMFYGYGAEPVTVREPVNVVAEMATDFLGRTIGG